MSDYYSCSCRAETELLTHSSVPAQQPSKASSTLLPRSFTRRAATRRAVTRRTHCTRTMSSRLYATRLIVLVFMACVEGRCLSLRRMGRDRTRLGARHVWNGLRYQKFK